MVKEQSIEGVAVMPLKQIRDDRGAVYHYLRADWPVFTGFGEAYYSRINESVIKGWKLHKKISQHFCVPFGTVKLVLYDNRIESSTRGLIHEITLDDKENYQLLTMPHGIWYSFKCMSKDFALLANIINMPHIADESENLPLNTLHIPYEWK